LAMMPRKVVSAIEASSSAVLTFRLT
jgi:hypothetical protein